MNHVVIKEYLLQNLIWPYIGQTGYSCINQPVENNYLTLYSTYCAFFSHTLICQNLGLWIMLTIFVEVSAHSVDTYTIACIFLPLLKVSFSRMDTFRKLKRRSKSVADLVIFLSYFHLSSHTVWPILRMLQKHFEKSFKSWKRSYKKHNVHTHT